ncbi:Putative type II secretion system protein F [Stieleria maiorica]|uniref:Type II secretion system protein F n=1 Tax=Stieleria maiorica TaxID=2795974 RepID=A0A5B9MQI1_9BACT|nr:hypothetical protein [Stieleria maiorica]QEG02491.1 Putative type II secretion system protein F [Stieleria maiorica]
MKIQSKGGAAGGAETLVPMKSLYDRIDQVRTARKDLPKQLRDIAEEIPGAWTRNTLRQLAVDLDRNVSSAHLVAHYPEHCWLLTLQSSAATTDALTAMLEQSAFQHGLRTKKIRTIAYPVVLLAIAATLMTAVIAILVPTFDEMYREFELRLPVTTEALVNVSRAVNAHPLVTVALLIAFLACLAGGLWAWIGNGVLKTKLLGPRIDGQTIRQSLAKTSLQVAELLDEGIELDRALKIAAESASEVTVRTLVGDLAIQAGHDAGNLHRTRAAMVFPPNFLFALSPTRPSTGSIASAPNTTMLRELAASYRELSIRRRDWIAFVLGQITVIGVGLMIGFLVLALFSPMISLVSALSS